MQTYKKKIKIDNFKQKWKWSDLMY